MAINYFLRLFHFYFPWFFFPPEERYGAVFSFQTHIKMYPGYPPPSYSPSNWMGQTNLLSRVAPMKVCLWPGMLKVLEIKCAFIVCSSSNTIPCLCSADETWAILLVWQQAWKESSGEYYKRKSKRRHSWR